MRNAPVELSTMEYFVWDANRSVPGMPVVALFVPAIH